jgi:hypothetical protein
MRARTSALLLLLPLLTGCAVGGSGGSDETPPPRPRATHTVVTTQSPLPLPTIEGSPVHFRTEDRNVGCDLEPAYVLCNVGSHTWRAPRKPSDCFYTWGKAVEFAIGTKGSFFCGHGESYLGSKRVLKVGQALQVGLVTCRAVTGGVTCSGQGHGFTFTRTSYKLF